VRGAGRGDDGDGRPGREAAGQEHGPAARARGHRGGALVGGERPRVPCERRGLLPRVVGRAGERRGAVARRQGDAVPEGAHGEGGGGVGRREVVGGGRGGEGGGAVEVSVGQVEHAAEPEGDEEEVDRPRREEQVRRGMREMVVVAARVDSAGPTVHVAGAGPDRRGATSEGTERCRLRVSGPPADWTKAWAQMRPVHRAKWADHYSDVPIRRAK
jgi:hypothetical protein